MRVLVLALLLSAAAHAETAAELYKMHCSGCHGVNLEGAQYTALRKDAWITSRNAGSMARVILFGIPGTDMAPFARVLSNDEARSIANFILESQDAEPTETREPPATLATEEYEIRVETLVDEGFTSEPWSIEFLDDRRALITQRRGGLRLMVDGELHPVPIGRIPATTQYSDSGLYDLALDPDFASNGWIYLAYVHALGDPTSRDAPAMTRVIRGRLKDHQFVDQETIFQLPDELHFARGTRWGSRMVFDREGRLYFSIGDIGRNDDVQQLDLPAGKVYRINPDGSIPDDNPYRSTPGALPALFTYGNRNVQGIDQDPATGDIWATEHGPAGGDELNVLESGRNYGWPAITYGLNYDGSIVSDYTHKPGMEQPVKYWTPSPGLGPLQVYTGEMFPKWKNQLLIGAMVFEEIKRLELDGREVVHEERFLKGYGRVRDLKVGPDGAIYLLLNNPNKVVRLSR